MLVRWVFGVRRVPDLRLLCVGVYGYGGWDQLIGLLDVGGVCGYVFMGWMGEMWVDV